MCRVYVCVCVCERERGGGGDTWLQHWGLSQFNGSMTKIELSQCVLWNRRKNFSIKVRQPLGTFKFRFQTAADLLAKEVHSDFCFVNLSSPELVPMLANFLSPSVFGQGEPNQGILKGDLLFDWFRISCMTSDNFVLFAKQANLNQSNRRSMVQ